LLKQIDTVAQWCFKQMRNTADSGNNHIPSGGDIGKIRCLVCDQPIKQQTEQEIVFGGPQMTHSIKSRKASPPRERERDREREKERGRSPPPNLNNYHANINNYHGGASGPDGSLKGTALKNKLTKLISTPTHTISKQTPISDSIDAFDTDLPLRATADVARVAGVAAADFIPLDAVATNRTDHSSGLESPKTRPITAPRVVATKQPTIVSSLSHPALQGATGAQQQQLAHDNYQNRDFVTDFAPKKDGATGADTITYFKELEGYVTIGIVPVVSGLPCFVSFSDNSDMGYAVCRKFSGTGGRRLTAAEIAAQRESGGGNKRPGSAPMKRTHNPAKLQSLGKPATGVGSGLSNSNSEKNPLLPSF
jgi:hypothetical protein